MITKEQKELLTRIEEQFEKINNEPVSDGLIPVSEILAEVQAKNDWLKQAEITNREFRLLLKEVVKNDIQKLNKELNKLGLVATKSTDSNYKIRIEPIIPLAKPAYQIRIEYYIQYESHPKYYTDIAISTYLTTTACNGRFQSIEEMFKNARVKESLKNVYETTLNK